jgi:hypothetical protein
VAAKNHPVPSAPGIDAYTELPPNGWPPGWLKKPPPPTSLPVRNTRTAPQGAPSVCYSPAPTSTTSFRRSGAAPISTRSYAPSRSILGGLVCSLPRAQSQTGSLDEEGGPSASAPAATASRTRPARGPESLLRNFEKGSRLLLNSPLYPTPKSARNSLGDRSPSIPARVHALTMWIAAGGAAVPKRLLSARRPLSDLLRQQLNPDI